MTLNHNLNYPHKKTVRQQDTQLVEKKKKLHDDLMSQEIKDLDTLTPDTYKTVLNGLKIKDKKMYMYLNMAGDTFKYVMFKFYEPIVNL